ncbi:protease m3 thimet oligopeptidase-related [Anaeramoeba flamelloides]|uniref:Protease m3 thimet oligopeptidase-related n=1 Tax=Anaeramoeba flamelloides TaxID=1746091 RepID=A0AAV7Y4F0_9EUKA|nr:protease m3 thimet oligopeptidase-related [Anaeramoeba flamelloides]
MLLKANKPNLGLVFSKKSLVSHFSHFTNFLTKINFRSPKEPEEFIDETTTSYKRLYNKLKEPNIHPTKFVETLDDIHYHFQRINSYYTLFDFARDQELGDLFQKIEQKNENFLKINNKLMSDRSIVKFLKTNILDKEAERKELPKQKDKQKEKEKLNLTKETIWAAKQLCFLFENTTTRLKYQGLYTKLDENKYKYLSNLAALKKNTSYCKEIENVFYDDNPTIRMNSFSEINKMSKEANEKTLIKILQNRNGITKLLGSPTFTQYILQLPDNVCSHPNIFLKRLLKTLTPKVKNELETLRILKAQKEKIPLNSCKIEAWDLNYYRNLISQKSLSNLFYNDFNTEIFSIGSCFNFLKIICNKFFSIQLSIEELKNEKHYETKNENETGNMNENGNGNGKVNAHGNVNGDENEDYKKIYKILLTKKGTKKKIGVIILDLISVLSGLNNKMENIQTSSKKLVRDQLEGQDISISYIKIGKKYPFFGLDMIESIVHEFGHAISNSFSNTYYHVSSLYFGSRAYNEIFSNLFENLLWDKQILKSISNEKISEKFADLLIKHRFSYQNLDLYLLSFTALFDLAVHNMNDIPNFQNLQNKIIQENSLIPQICNQFDCFTSPELVKIASEYYSYPFAKSISKWIYKNYFENTNSNSKIIILTTNY